MVVLIIEPLDPDVMQWLVSRHAVRYAPELARDPAALRRALPLVRALVVPASVALDAQTLALAPQLKAVGRLSAGLENIDQDFCNRAGIEVVRASESTAQAEAEFAVGALLQMLRRVPVLNAEGLLVGRELCGATVGLVGMGPTAQPLARLLGAFGARVLGYDPMLHAAEPIWSEWSIEPVQLRTLVETSDGLCVMLNNFLRYQKLLGERLLPFCKPHQVLVSLSPSDVFDHHSLAEVLASGRMAAAWFDSMQPDALDDGQPLATAEHLQVTPRVAGTTRESRLRAAWEVAQRIDMLLSMLPQRGGG